MSRTIRFEVTPAPALLEGVPAEFATRVARALEPWGIADIVADGMTCTAHSYRSTFTGLMVDVRRVPGTATLRVFVEPTSRAWYGIWPLNVLVFLEATYELTWLVPGARSAFDAAGYAAFLIVAAAFVPIVLLEMVVVRLLNRVRREEVDAIAETVRRSLEN